MRGYARGGCWTRYAMGTNGAADSVPAVEGISPVHPGVERREGALPARDADDDPLLVDCSPALGAVSRPRARIGRPTTLTPGLAKKLVKLVAELGAIEPAARLCGVPPQTVRGWITRGEDRHSQGRPPTPEYVAFVASVEKALGQWEYDRLARIAAAGEQPRNWTANAWLLERRWPERYGRRATVEVSGSVTMAQVRALLDGVFALVERYVPEERRESEIANLAAVADQIGASVNTVPSGGEGVGGILFRVAPAT